MGWVQITKAGASALTPSIKVSRTGRITLNEAAYSAIGRPQKVLLYFNKETDQVAIAPADADANHSFSVRQFGATRFAFAARQMINQLELRPVKAKSIPARLEDDKLVADLEAVRSAPQAPDRKPKPH
jgi:hypothetical protein